MGVDLGQSNDSTAIAVVRKIERYPDRPVFQVGRLFRAPLGTSYPAIVAIVMNLLALPRFRGKTDLVIDATGCGCPVFDMFRGCGVSPIGVLITGGDSTSRDGAIWRVPKVDLVGLLTAIGPDGRLHVHKHIPGEIDAETLKQEIRNFRSEFTDSGYIRFNARSGKHDDLLLALAIACWYANGNADPTFGNWMSYMHRENGAAVSYRAAASSNPALVRLRRPEPSTVTHVYTMAGHSVAMDGDTVELSAEDAKPLLASGWKQIEAAP
jgi:hypothetical protein